MLSLAMQHCGTSGRSIPEDGVGSLADTMNKRPLSVTVIGCIFVAAGVIGLAYHVTEFKTERPFEYGLVWVSLLRLLAIPGGVFVLRGNN